MKKIVPIVGAFGLGLFHFLFNLAHLNRTLDLDSVQYYLDVELGTVWHPHHLLYTSVGRLLTYLLRTHAGYSHSPMLVMQIGTLAGASIALSVAVWAFWRFSRRPLTSVLFIGLIACSHGFWYYSTLNETPLLPASAALIFFVAVTASARAARTTLRKDIAFGIGLGALHAAAVGLHQTNVLMALPALILIFLESPHIEIRHWAPALQKVVQNGRTIERRILLAGVYGTTGALLTIALYLAVGLGQMKLPLTKDQPPAPIPGLARGGTFFDWVLMYGHWDKNNQWGVWQRPRERENVARGAVRALFATSQSFLWSDGRENAPESAFDKRLLILSLGIAGAAALLTIIALMQKRFTAVAGWAWILPFSFLASWWEPAHFEFWVMPVTALWTTIFFAWTTTTSRPMIPRLVSESASGIVFGIVLALVILNNYSRSIRPRSSAVVFGHWEDLYDKDKFAHLLDSAYRQPMPVFKGDPEHEWSFRLVLLADLRLKMADDKNLDFFPRYRLQYEQTLSAMERMFPGRSELGEAKVELEFLQSGRDAWLSSSFGNAARSALEEQQGRRQK